MHVFGGHRVKSVAFVYMFMNVTVPTTLLQPPLSNRSLKKETNNVSLGITVSGAKKVSLETWSYGQGRSCEYQTKYFIIKAF